MRTAAEKRLANLKQRDPARSSRPRAQGRDYKGYDATRGKPEKKPFKCKERPKDNRPKKGGGGGKKKFVPWC